MELDILIKRINELAHKQKSVGLTPEEKEEQTILRNEYREKFRTSLRGTLNTIDVQDKNGNIQPLKKKDMPL